MDTDTKTKPKNDCAGCGEADGIHPPVWRITDSMEVLPDASAGSKTDLKFCNRCFMEYEALANDRRDAAECFVTGVGWIPQEY